MRSRSTQFGLRENTASQRLHDSRLATQSAMATSIRLTAAHDDPPVEPTSSEQEPSKRLESNAADTASTEEEERRHDHLLTVSEVANLLQVPVSWVYGRIRRRAADRIPGYRLGKYWRFSESEVVRWIERQHTGVR